MRKIIQNNHHLEKGQVIPILVIGILITVMMAALLIDVGMVLSHRRTAQAAADAGALAAVKSLCPGSSATNADAKAVAIAFVEENDAEFITLPEGEQFPEDHTIRVEARAASQAFFGGIFDQLGLSANAAAEANCAAVGVEGVVLQMPIAVPCLNKEVENDQIINCGNINLDGTTIILDTSEENKKYCARPPWNYSGGVECDDINNNSSRGWLNLGGKNSSLRIDCWMGGDCKNNDPIPPIIDRITWLSSTNGGKNDLKKFDDYIDQEFYVGIYDTQERRPPSSCPEDEDCYFHGGGHNVYRIVGYARFTLTRASDKEVEGFFTETLVYFGSGGGGGSGNGNGQFVVQLTQ